MSGWLLFSHLFVAVLAVSPILIGVVWWIRRHDKLEGSRLKSVERMGETCHAFQRELNNQTMVAFDKVVKALDKNVEVMTENRDALRENRDVMRRIRELMSGQGDPK